MSLPGIGHIHSQLAKYALPALVFRLAKFGEPRQRALPHRQECPSRTFFPSGTAFRPPAKLGRLRGVRFCPPGEVLFCFCCPSGTGFRHPAKFGTPARRAARWGRLWGCAPFSAPLASPPKHPQRRFSISVMWRGQRGICCGSFPPSLRSFR